MLGYDLISRHRKELMGFATIWIAVLHATMWFSFPLLSAFKATGNSGVDMFLFLSAFGLYFSYKYGDRHYIAFEKRRFRRILPAYLLIGVLRCIYYGDSFSYALFRLSTLSYWLAEDKSVWFIACIIPLYLIAPLYLRYFNNDREEKMTIAAVFLGLVIGFIFRYYPQSGFASRLSVFFLGFLAGKYADEKKQLTRRQAILSFLCMAVSLGILSYAYLCLDLDHLHMGWALKWLPVLVFTMPLCLWLSALLEKCRTSKLLTSFGEVSLEFYMLFEMMIRVLDGILVIPQFLSYHNIAYNVIVMAITLALCRLLKILEGKLLNKK